MFFKKKKNKGFTLVELIVVIAILAILVGLLVPQYTKYVEKSRKSADINNLNEIVNAIKVAASDPEYHLGSNSKPETYYTIVISDDKIALQRFNIDEENNQVVEALVEYTGIDLKKEINGWYVSDTIKIKSHKWGMPILKGNPWAESGIAAEVQINNVTSSITVTYSENVKNYIDHGTIDSK